MKLTSSKGYTVKKFLVIIVITLTLLGMIGSAIGYLSIQKSKINDLRVVITEGLSKDYSSPDVQQEIKNILKIGNINKAHEAWITKFILEQKDTVHNKQTGHFLMLKLKMSNIQIDNEQADLIEDSIEKINKIILNRKMFIKEKINEYNEMKKNELNMKIEKFFYDSTLKLS